MKNIRLLFWILLTLVSAQHVNAQTTEITICPGETKVLRVTAPEVGLTYVWYKDGAEILSPINDSIFITEPGEYKVIAENSIGCQSELSAPVTVSFRELLAVNDWSVTNTSIPVTIPVVDNDEEGCFTIDTMSITIVTFPSNGSIDVTPDGTVIYTPLSGFVGLDTFTYTVSDMESNLSNVATVIVEVLDDPLTVNMLYFEAIAQGKKSKLEWEVSEIKDIAYFEIERSKDAVSFHVIGKEISTTTLNYTHWDTNPEEGYNYYRIRMIGHDGHSKGTSVIRLVRIQTESYIEVYPNPTYNIITVKTDEGQTLTSIELVDVHGKVLQTFQPDSHQTQISLEAYSAGTYFVRCINSENKSLKVFKVQKL